MPAAFLDDFELRQLQHSDDLPFSPRGFALGQGAQALEIVVADADSRPTATDLRRAWIDRHGGRAVPLLLVVLHDGQVSLCGPAGEKPPVYQDREREQVDRLCRAALASPDRHAALALLRDALPETASRIPGIKNAGLLATHELENGVPKRPDWSNAVDRAGPLLGTGGKDLLSRMGYSVDSLASGRASLLIADGTRQAIAVFVERGESVELASQRFSGLSPISYALDVARQHRLPWVVVASERMLRLYPVEPGTGVGSRGGSETYVQLRLDLLRRDQAGYLWLLFSPDALGPSGTLEEILATSRDYAAHLSGRLRERIYDEVVPRLAESIGRARGFIAPTQEQLEQTYEMALLVLFRLLFVAYAEDQRLLPYDRNESYRARSLKQKARELLDIVTQDGEYGATHTHWREVHALFDAVREGNPEWDVPQYDGGLFSVDPEISPSGASLEEVELANPDFGPALANLLLDEGPDGLGPIDFRSLGVREFGTIYEGLLESELSVAEHPLTRDDEGRYIPADKAQQVLVQEGSVYLHDISGRRKSTGTYYTKAFAVEHLIEHALEPALERHVEGLRELDEVEAAERFFDFRVADIAMGSGHFLIAAVDHIERRLTQALRERQLPGVQQELERLRRTALEALGEAGAGIEIEDGQLLRRQIARRCIYGVDINPVAVQLARLSIWIHTFVPGLPLSFLDHGLVEGNSLLGMGTIEEAEQTIGVAGEQLPVWYAQLLDVFGRARDALETLGKLSDATAAEIEAAREAQREIEQREAPIAALFDVLTAARIDKDLRERLAAGAVLDWEDLTSLVESPYQRRAREALSPLTPFHFPVRFPEVFRRDQPGFDVIVGNPPWQEATVEEDQFWTRYHPGFKGLSERERAEIKDEYRASRPDLVTKFRTEKERAELVRQILKSGAFAGMGTGDPDLYKAFAWRFWQLTHDKGHIGVVLPQSILATKGSAPWRQAVLLRSAAHVALCKNKEEWLFTDVNPGYAIALVDIQRLQVREPTLHLSGTFESREEFEQESRGAEIDTKRLQEVDPLLCVPAIESPAAFDLFSRLIRHPAFGDEDRSDWRARPSRELDVTNDSHFFRSDGDPVFNHLNIGHFVFDESAGSYALADFDEVAKHLQERRLRAAGHSRSAFSEMPREWIEDPKTLPCRNPRVAYRAVIHATNPRKIWAAVVPPRCVLTNAAPYLLFPSGDLQAQAYVLGMLNSSVCDWLGHLRVVLNLNYFILNSFPVPQMDRGPRFNRLTELAAYLALQGQRDLGEWETLAKPDVAESPEEATAELDALASALYELEDEHLSLIWGESEDSTRPLLSKVRYYRQEWHT